MAGKTRSPKYPGLSLPQTLAVLRRLWDAERRTELSNEAAALAMGFKSLSGPARVAIGALKQFGLIDKTGKGALRVSDLGTKIMLADEPERTAAIAEASRQPQLFQELAETHSDASENSIRLYLTTKRGYLDDGARKAARAFKETLASTGSEGYNDRDDDGAPQDMTGTQTVQLSSPTAGGSAGKVPDGVFSLTVPFAKGTIAVQVRVTGEAIQPAHLSRVRKYLELAESEWDGADVDE